MMQTGMSKVTATVTVVLAMQSAVNPGCPQSNAPSIYARGTTPSMYMHHHGCKQQSEGRQTTSGRHNRTVGDIRGQATKAGAT